MIARALLLGLATVLAGGAVRMRPAPATQTSVPARGAPTPPTFPHATHAGLFPLCTGCHAGIPAGDRTRFYPSPALCASCHDGQIQPRVQWSAPNTLPSNVAFSHPQHEADAGEAVQCMSCHASRTPPVSMAVTRARPELCIRCHTHAAPSHLAMQARCPVCHVPLARAAGVPRDTVAAFPRPETHAASDFVLAHGATATVGEVRSRCAMCHARESCARCHPNAAQLPAVALLESDARVATVVAAKAPVWPLPASHRDPSWLRTHGGAAAARPQSCANCHTQTGCRSCHAGGSRGGAGGGTAAALTRPGAPVSRDTPVAPPGARAARGGAEGVIGQLPLAAPGGPVGALAVRTASGQVLPASPAGLQAGRPLAEVPVADAAAPPSRNLIHPAGFATNHGAAAATNDPSCTSCHQQRFCRQCHNGPTRPVFHAPAYLSRHAADVYAAASNCESCHNTESFCRACHRGAGLTAAGRTDVAFHTGQPLWLVQHGQAAREGIESCATCHAQQTCLRCHSTLTQKVNPHGPGFDAARVAKKAPLMCARCHIGPPPTKAR
ncbi:MAG TPA: hypothetical protein VF832_04135 [Longimicrobiales bacterium]